MTKTLKDKKLLVLLDSHAILHRAFHALPPFTSPKGEPTGALYGFTSMLLKIIREIRPDYIAACFDLPEPTFRHAAFKEYKAHRPETSLELISQLEHSREILEAFEIPVYEKGGFEADDVIGTIVEKTKKYKDLEVIIATGDLDALQLAEDRRVKVYTLRKGIKDTVVYDKKAVERRFGFGPEFLADFKGLKGDPSDNIPGVPGIGDKTASDLIIKFGSLENILKLAEKQPDQMEKKGVKKRIIELLQKHKEDALFSKTLGIIRQDVSVEFDLEDSKLNILDFKNTEKIFAEFGFNSLINRLKDLGGDDIEINNLESPLPSNGDMSDLERAKNIFWFLKDGGIVGAVLEDGKTILLEDVEKNKAVLQKAFDKGNNRAFNAKSLMHYFSKFDIKAQFGDDLQIMFYLADSRITDPTLEQMIDAVLPEESFSKKDIISKASLFPKAFKALQKEVKEKKLEPVYKEIELPLVGVLAGIEKNGILLDVRLLKSLSKKYDKELKRLEKEIFKLSGEEFNISSPKQVAEILFDKLELSTKGLKKTGGGARSTRFSELVKLKDEHSIVEKILSFRELAKLKSTYVDVLPRMMADDKRLHTTFHQTGTATGRLSSSDPNLQNVPIKSDFGKDVRRAFVADKGSVLLAFDYSQIELRVAAILSKDKKMTEAFLKGEDIHTATAKEIFNVKGEDVTKEMRRQAKIINFGILYGMGVRRLQEELGVSQGEASKFLNEYFKDFGGISKYIEKVKEDAEINGYVETLFGRKRFLPEIISSFHQIKREAERMAVNTPIQGTAADIMKIGMIKVQEFIAREKKFSENVKMLLQIHDELLFEVKKPFLKQAIGPIKDILENVYKDKVPFVVNVSAGLNWADLEELKK